MIVIRRWFFAMALVFGIASPGVSDAFFDPPYITPAKPIADQEVSVNVYGGVCDAISSHAGDPSYPHVVRKGEQITITYFGARHTDIELCFFPIGTVVTVLGGFPRGSYEVDVRLYYMDDFGDFQTAVIGTTSFVVAGGSPAGQQSVATPALGRATIPLLAILLLGLGVIGVRARFPACLVTALIAAPLSGRAEEIAESPRLIELLLTRAPGAPSPDEVIRYFEQDPRPGPPPLESLTMGDPQQATYLLPVRAEGDFLTLLEEHPDSVRAKLEWYLIVLYPPGTDLSPPLAALRADPFVEAAYEPLPTSFSSASLTHFDVVQGGSAGDGQYGWADLNIAEAWTVAGGYSLISNIDSGLYTQHAAFQQFSSNGQYRSGNFVSVLSLDISLVGQVNPPQNSTDVDERRAMPVSDPICNSDPVHHPDLPPDLAGHGTHTSGLIGANQSASYSVQGTCRHCGIAMWKVASAQCLHSTQKVVPAINVAATAAALTRASDVGSQVANMSFGAASSTPFPTYCKHNQSQSTCLAITHASHRDVAMVASSGNGRTQLDFPAADPNVVAVGGFEPGWAVWDLWPNCPIIYGLSQCGSNFTTNIAYGARQEVVASAQSVLSTTYPGYDWNPDLECGDSVPGPGFGNGTGWCTGTSMSAPQISGVIGILRSINPLVRAGSDPLISGTIRNVLATTTFEAKANQPWDQFLGYGRPDAAAAARRMLGTVAGAPVRNRATPLFRLYSAGAHDYADTVSPQTAVALMVNASHAWQPPSSLPAVPNYSNFPHDPADGSLAAPRASVYVLATEVKPRSEWPDLIPLHLMDRSGPGVPIHDFILVSSVPDIEYAHHHGYDLRTIQGYIYKPCAKGSGCAVPPGTQAFYRACHGASGDCATFLQSEASTFASAGYTTTFPPSVGTRTLLGYAYPATDSDGDGLPDAFEYVVGTSPTRSDSDADGMHDAAEFPMVGVPVGDPCHGGTGARYCGADTIFKNAFELP